MALGLGPWFPTPVWVFTGWVRCATSVISFESDVLLKVLSEPGILTFFSTSWFSLRRMAAACDPVSSSELD
jgi:hypothetical protein